MCDESCLESLQQNEIERKTNQLAGREFESNILQKQNELFTVEQKIKALSREKDIMDADSEDRVLLSFKKSEVETSKKKHRKMQVKSLSPPMALIFSLAVYFCMFSFYFYLVYACIGLFGADVWFHFAEWMKSEIELKEC